MDEDRVELYIDPTQDVLCGEEFYEACRIAAEAPETSTSPTWVRGVKVYILDSSLIRVEFPSLLDISPDIYPLSIRKTLLRESGTSHFPAAGVYQQGGPAEMFARVDHVLEPMPAHKPSAQEVLAWATSHMSELNTETAVLEIGVPLQRVWKLTMTGPKPWDLDRGYKELRAGTWKPNGPFTDVLTDPEKIVRHVETWRFETTPKES